MSYLSETFNRNCYSLYKHRMRIFIAIALIILTGVFTPTSTYGQAMKVAAGNTLIGTANGAILGLGVMGLTNNTDLTPLRFGVGAGTLFGLGVAVYDFTRMDGLGYYVVEGTFNSTEYTSLIIILDTFYGSVTGSVLGMAVSLMANERIDKGIQYGASAGAIVGFGFGLVDAFHLSNNSSTFAAAPNPNAVNGLVQIFGDGYNIGLLQPINLQHYSLSGSGNMVKEHQLGLSLAHLKLRF